ncbi:MAG: hypothetical protein JSV62_14360 [Promethearchaeota archaeon]|nr:MAG: hypothetical protein JSV62_14360 [Candidatus Lokiarchaeota archaeon]
MFNSTTKKRIQALGILFLIIGTFTTYFNLYQMNINTNSNGSNKELDEKSYIFEIEYDDLKTADYSDNYNSTGGNINTKLHQSYTNSSNIYFPNLDNSNSFNADCPMDTNFNSSIINVEVENINAPDKSFIIEDVLTFKVLNPVNDHFVSITSRGFGYIENISLYVNRTSTNPTTLNVYLYNSRNVSNQPRPNNLVYLTPIAISSITRNNPHWLNLTNIHSLFNCSKTFQDTFFLQFEKVGVSTDIDMFGDFDISGTDDEIVLNSLGAIHLVGGQSVDVGLKIDYSPLNNTPIPSQINLKVNGSAVTDSISGLNEGYWLNKSVYSSSSGELEFKLTAEWWDVSCNVRNIQINYTKTDLTAPSSFYVESSGKSINWNSSIAAITSFGAKFSAYRINFTVPASWENFTAFRGALEKTSDITLGPISNNFRELQISNASNGNNWYIAADSTNLVENIQTSVNSILRDTVNFTNIVDFLANFSVTISDGAINLSVYSPSSYLNHSYYDDSISTDSDIPLGNWDISDVSSRDIEYGPYIVQVHWNNDTAAGFLEKTLTIVAVTELVLDSPQNGQIHFDDEVFDITVFYNDTGPNMEDKGITGASFTENSSLLGPATPGASDGYYTLELNTSKFTSNYGWNYIEIEASAPNHQSAIIVFSFHLQAYTKAIPSKDFGDVIRGFNRTYIFNYSNIANNPILGADINVVSLPSGFQYEDDIVGNGNYSIKLITSNVVASSSPYTCNFSISATGSETQNIELNIRIILSQSSIQILKFNDSLVKKDGFNQTVRFYFNDTDNDWGIPDLPVANITVTHNQTGGPSELPIWLYSDSPEGVYILNISVSDLDSGWIRLLITINFEPNYNISFTTIDFDFIGNYTQSKIISISDPNGEGVLRGIGNEYTCFEERDLNIEFNITDTDNSNALVTGPAISYLVEYVEIGNPTNQGTLGESLSFGITSYLGGILTSDLPSVGTYAITIKVFKTNFETSIVQFNLTLRARYIINISVVRPPHITAGDSFDIIVTVKYFNVTWLLAENSSVRLTPYLNGIPGTPTVSLTNSTGEVEFQILTSSTVTNVTLTIEVLSSYYHVTDTRQVLDIVVHGRPSGLSFEQLLPYIIIIGAAIGIGGGSFALYRGVVVPKKREKTRILTEVKTIFDDAINLEHILVLYKGSGTCIYFKSFGSEQIDPELISGFISAISSFGKDLVSQEELNEISYGDKMLLLSDGEHIRVALVLSKKASLILRRNLMEFIHVFEKAYANALPNWRGQLNIFRDAGSIVDELLSTSIILPHEITYEHSTTKALKKPQSRDVIKIANNLMKESERNFFFIATLLKEATEKTGKDTAEIFMGIKELRDTKILMPIEISTIEAKPISQQELNLINQKISGLINLTPEEKQKLVNDLAQMGPPEREAYFASLAERHEIVSAPVETKPGAIIIDTLKAAKKEIKNLKKNALKARKEKEHENSIKILQNALKIASNWELTNTAQELDDLIRTTKIEDLKNKMKSLENEARLAAKEENYNEAAQKYKMSSRIASEIFKLGEDMTKEVKRLSNKAKEYEKLV